MKQTAGLHLKKDLAKFDMLRTVVLPSFTPFPVYGAGPQVYLVLPSFQFESSRYVQRC